MKERTHEHDKDAERPASIWDELREDPLFESTDPIVIKRSFARRLFGTLYDRLGALILLNLAVSAQVFVAVLLGLLLGGVLRANAPAALIAAALVVGLIGAPALAGLFYYVRLVCDEDSLSSLRDYLRGMRMYATRSWILLAGQALSGGLLVINLQFYASVAGLGGRAIELFIFILLIVWAMGGAYAWPLLVRDMGWRLLVRNSFFLALAAPFSTLAMLVGLGLVGTLLVLTKVGAILLLFAVWALTENLALQRLVRIFTAQKEPAPEPADEPVGQD